MIMTGQNKMRDLVITGLMGAIAVVLGLTHWGFIPWFGGVALTIMHVPAVIAPICMNAGEGELQH